MLFLRLLVEDIKGLASNNATYLAVNYKEAANTGAALTDTWEANINYQNFTQIRWYQVLHACMDT